MVRPPLPRLRIDGAPPIGRGRQFARTTADSVADVLHPLVALSRGLRVLAAAGRRTWVELPGERRGPTLFLAAACAFVVYLLPYGPLASAVGLIGAAGWAGRRRAPASPGPGADGTERLRTIYESLVPYFSAAEDPSPLYGHGGDWSGAFESYAFDENGRLTRLRLRYPAYFTDGEAESRARIEQLLYAKSGRGREYLFTWDEEANRLTLAVLPPLSTTIGAQRFVTAPGETVLGFTDDSSVQRTLPVLEGDGAEEGESGTRDVPPVVWRTGPRSTEPHLLALGQPGSGTTTLLRSIALQALPHGDVLVVDGSGTGEYASLSGRTGVLAVECGLAGTLATLEWAGHETERRLIAANRARQLVHPPPDDILRPLWILLDRPSVLSHLGAADGRPDPQELLAVPLRHGRAANVRVVVADQLDAAEGLSQAVRTHTRARVVLGPATSEQVTAVLGAPPHTTPPPEVPPGRGYARLGTGPVHRLQVPATPDPYDEATSEAQRQAVLQLLPEPETAAELTATAPTDD
ncbi:ABC transporter ATP-binding protein [Streptomyces sp. NPDC005271]|uniref:ATP-binding cassette domain-containing protein n=1 Tax=unclassified Streptomyces TaxID=2593676 RepID=UPI0033B5AE70